MKILEIVYGLGSGGEERLVVDLSNELSKTEDVHLLVLKDVEQFYAPQLSQRIKVYYLKLPVGFSVKQTWVIYKFIKEISPDIVHMHDASRYYVLLSSILLRRDIKFYMTIHSDVLKAYKNGISGMQVKLAHYLGRTRFITISPQNHAQFKSIYPGYKVCQITNGRAAPLLSTHYDEVKAEIEHYKKNKDTIVFLHVATCIPVKNQELLFTAFNQFTKNGANAILLVIGNRFDSQLGQHLKLIANNNIHILGTKQNVYDYMACADAFCLSSLREGMPMSIIEAVLSGLPIISTTVCGAVDAIKNGENGYLSPDFEIATYADLLAKFAENKNLLQLYAQQNKGNSIYNISSCAKQYVNWFKD